MPDRRTQWTGAESAPGGRSDQSDQWGGLVEPKRHTHNVVLLPHGPMPVCDSWMLELPSTVRTRPHAACTRDAMGEVGIPMS